MINKIDKNIETNEILDRRERAVVSRKKKEMHMIISFIEDKSAYNVLNCVREEFLNDRTCVSKNGMLLLETKIAGCLIGARVPL